MNTFEIRLNPPMRLSAVVLAALLAGCGGGGDTLPAGSADTDASAMDVATSTNSADNVVTGTQVTVPFGQVMDPATINSAQAGTQLTFTLKDSSVNNVLGTVAMNAENTAATFTPSVSALTPNTAYTATVSTAAKTAQGSAIATPMHPLSMGMSEPVQSLVQPSASRAAK